MDRERAAIHSDNSVHVATAHLPASESLRGRVSLFAIAWGREALSTVARGGASHARNARRWVSCPRQPFRRMVVSSADSRILLSVELARSLAGHIASPAIDGYGAVCRDHHARKHEQRFTLAESVRLMPVIASPLLATSSAKTGLISWEPVGRKARRYT